MLAWGTPEGHGSPLMFPVLVHTRAWGAEQWIAGDPLSPSVGLHVLGIPSPAPHPAPALPLVRPCPAPLVHRAPLFGMTVDLVQGERTSRAAADRLSSAGL